MYSLTGDANVCARVEIPYTIPEIVTNTVPTINVVKVNFSNNGYLRKWTTEKRRTKNKATKTIATNLSRQNARPISYLFATITNVRIGGSREDDVAAGFTATECPFYGFFGHAKYRIGEMKHTNVTATNKPT